MTFSQRICKCQKLHKSSLLEVDRVVTAQLLLHDTEAGSCPVCRPAEPWAQGRRRRKREGKKQSRAGAGPALECRGDRRPGGLRATQQFRRGQSIPNDCHTGLCVTSIRGQVRDSSCGRQPTSWEAEGVWWLASPTGAWASLPGMYITAQSAPAHWPPQPHVRDPQETDRETRAENVGSGLAHSRADSLQTSLPCRGTVPPS